jgi:hypothetical protein
MIIWHAEKSGINEVEQPGLWHRNGYMPDGLNNFSAKVGEQQGQSSVNKATKHIGTICGPYTHHISTSRQQRVNSLPVPYQLPGSYLRVLGALAAYCGSIVFRPKLSK